MDIKELTDMLVASSEDFHQSKFIPWWVEDYEKFMYRYHMMEEGEKQQAEECLAGCTKEDLLAPVGKLGLTLFHLAVWHNFYDSVAAMLEEGRIGAGEVDVPDHMGHGLTPFLLACARGNLAMVRLLAKHGAKDSAVDDRGMNAYHFLAYPRFEDLSNDADPLERSVGQRAEIARMLTCDINRKNAKGFTPLEHMLSVSYCDEYTWTLPEVFLEKGAATDYVDEGGNTLLMMARRNGHDTAALLLMKKCPELLNIANKDGLTPVQHAIEYRNNAMYLALIDFGAEPVPNEYAEQFSLSEITCSAFGQVRPDNKDSLSLGLYLAEKLIRQTDVDDDDDVGEVASILQSALRSDEEARVLDICKAAGLDFMAPVYYHGDVLCLRDECLGAGCGVDVIRKLMELGVDMDTPVVKGRTPAYLLADDDYRDQEEEDLLEQAAKLFSRESMEQTDSRGIAAIHRAARYGHTGMLKAMIEKGVDINLTEDAPAEVGQTPLHEACNNGQVEVVKLLMAAGADDAKTNLKGEAPIHLALRKKRFGKDLETNQRIQLVKELKNLDIPGEDGRTPLMLLEYGTWELLPFLLERGVDVNHADNEGMTALMLHGDKDVVKELVRAGADINKVDHEGNTALHHALERGDEGMARYLIKKGADYNCPNNSGETPASLAVESGYDAVLALMTDIR